MSPGPSSIAEVIVDVASRLERLDLSFALIGGLAVSARSQPRFTRDIDLAVAVPSDTVAESLVQALLFAGYQSTALVEHRAARRLATARLLAPGRVPREVDLVFASSGIEPEVVSAASSVTVAPGLRLPVAVVGHLIALKTLSRVPQRPQDAMDLAALFRVATPRDLAKARAACRLITARGYNRGRALADLLTEALEELRPEGPKPPRH